MKTISMNYDEYLHELDSVKASAKMQMAADYESYMAEAVVKARLEGAEDVIRHLLSAIDTGDINKVFKINHKNIQELKIVAAAMLGAFVKREEKGEPNA